MKKLNTTGYLLILPVLLSSFITSCRDNDDNPESKWKKEIDLKGEWKFSIGDDIKWSEKNFKDKAWEDIKVPSSWENEGFHGYDGYAWYRKHFSVSSILKNKGLYLNLGTIDDVDEVYINGKFAGATGSFPPQYETAYYTQRNYPIPDSLINFDNDNVVAVRVYDGEFEGGIKAGEPGIYIIKGNVYPDIHLEGTWKLNTGDSLQWKEPYFNDQAWHYAVVPGYWETQGHKDYDGFAWYRKSFFLPKDYSGKKLIFCAGKIDDNDQVYINGALIGSHGSFDDTLHMTTDQSTWQQYRTYEIPQEILRPGKNNLIAIRVYDGGFGGGIYEGPIGIVTRENYTKYFRSRK